MIIMIIFIIDDYDNHDNHEISPTATDDNGKQKIITILMIMKIHQGPWERLVSRRVPVGGGEMHEKVRIGQKEVNVDGKNVCQKGKWLSKSKIR